MERYRELVDKYFAEKSGLVIENRDTDHASILVSTLFNKAKEQMLLLCQNLNGHFYNSQLITNSILNAVIRGVRVRILVQGEPQADELIQKLREYPDKVEIRICTPGSEGSELPVNFAVMDETAYRVETDKEQAKAFACANDPTTAKIMVERFNYLFSLAPNESATKMD